MVWLWIGLAVILSLPCIAALLMLLLYLYLVWRYLDYVVRIFQEKPLFIVPRGQPVDGAEEVCFTTADGLALHGCYFRTSAAVRQGVILFGIEFGSNCWSCVPYCDHLVANGFDVFAFEPRNHGDSDCKPGYEPLQWITSFEVLDFQAALAYLKQRPDTARAGIGFFGISKGGGAGLVAASRDPYVRCCLTDGIFGTFTTMIPYMRKWIAIYSDWRWLQVWLPTWYYRLVGRAGLRRIARERGCRFPHLERAVARLSPRPLLMIHGGADTYIKPEMAQALYERAGSPKEFWLVDGAKHNQALQVAGDDYRQRVLDFFQMHLGRLPTAGPRRPETRALSLTRE